MLKSTFYTLILSVDPISLSFYITDGILSQFYVNSMYMKGALLRLYHYLLVKIHVGLVEPWWDNQHFHSDVSSF